MTSRAYRSQMSGLLAAENSNYVSGSDTISGFKNGYGPAQQEVVAYAFLAAYTGRKPSDRFIDRFPKIPRPNWRITYDGLSKLKFFQKFLQSFSLSHGYRSI